ncbi:MAG: hypothetical protein JRI67_13155 [Deltaproteobacteria bacterium]|nr:hypothetical protein [Deltaproteobacteria bacterium]
MEPIPVSGVQMPKINIFEKEGYGNKYLSEKETAEKQLELEKAFSPITFDNDPEEYELYKEDLDTKGRGEFLFEGVKAGSGYLVLVLKDSYGKIVTKDKVYINIKPLRHLYYMANARNCSCKTCESDNPNCVIWPAGTAVSADNDTGYDWDFKNFNKPNLTVFVHGYNVDKCSAISTFDKVFKRLYWTGVTNPEWEYDESITNKQKGSDFIGLAWQGNETRDVKLPLDAQKVLHFPRNVFNAFQASLPVGKFLEKRRERWIDQERVNVFAHSLGNMLVSNAIQKTPGLGLGKYVLHQAAVPANAYNALTGTNNTQRKWYEMLASLKGQEGDPWGDCFAQVPGRVEMINTYSETDPVVKFAFSANELFNRPDMAIGGSPIDILEEPLGLILGVLGIPSAITNSCLAAKTLIFPRWTWENLPEQENLSSDISRTWAELAYYFQALSYGAGVGTIDGVTNFDGKRVGIDNHGDFVNKPLFDVWEFWSFVANELKPPE